MTGFTFDHRHQISATVRRKFNGDGYRRWTATKWPYGFMFWAAYEAEQSEYVGDADFKAHDDEIALRVFQAEYRLHSFSFHEKSGFTLHFSNGQTKKIAAGMVSIRFIRAKFASDRALPFVDVKWHGRGRREGPFTSVEETGVVLTFRNRAHMGKFFDTEGSHLPDALRHDGRVYLKNPGGFTDSSGDMLPIYVLLWLTMSSSDRSSFASNNASLLDKLPDESSIASSVVGYTDDDFRAAIAAEADNPTPSADADAGSDAAQPDLSSQQDTSIQADTPSVDSSPMSVDTGNGL